MPRDAAVLPAAPPAVESPRDLAGRVRHLNARFDPKDACGLLGHVLSRPDYGPLALVSSFGADSVVLLHMLSGIDRDVPVLFVETGMLFAETLRYQARVARTLGLGNVVVVRPERTALFRDDPDGILHLSDGDGCCALRKVEPLARALAPYSGWISGRKRFQGGRRAGLDLAEADASGRLKLNPLAHWTPGEISDYMTAFALPRHPLVARGYASIGCAPCTRPTQPGEDPRAGRWPGRGKDECGIHFIGGKAVRT